MNSSSTVQFRRIHGRIVPIGVKKSGRAKATRGDEKKSAAGYIATGSAFSVGAGFAAGRTDLHSTYLKAVSKGFKSKARRLLDQAARTIKGKQLSFEFNRLTTEAADQMKLSVATGKEAARFHAGSRAMRRSGVYIGGAIIGHGIYKMLPKEFRKENQAAALSIASAGGLASAYGVRAAYYKGLGLPVKKALKLAFTRVISRGFRL